MERELLSCGFGASDLRVATTDLSYNCTYVIDMILDSPTDTQWQGLVRAPEPDPVSSYLPTYFVRSHKPTVCISNLW